VAQISSTLPSYWLSKTMASVRESAINSIRFIILSSGYGGISFDGAKYFVRHKEHQQLSFCRTNLLLFDLGSLQLLGALVFPTEKYDQTCKSD